MKNAIQSFKSMSITAKITTGCIIALGIYDLYAVASGGVSSSISQFMKTSGADAPFVIFTIGYICGHIFGFMRQKCKNCGGVCA